MSGENSAEELNTAKTFWICNLEKNVFIERQFDKTKELLGVYEHENGYLRCKGELGRGKLTFDTKVPMLLPNFHHFNDLVI